MPGTVLGTGETVVAGSVLAFTTGNLLSSQQAKAGTPWPGVEAPCFTLPQVLSPPSFRTLRDSLSGWDPETLSFLLREELQAYKVVRADTGQERFNVICDLLELSPEETPAGTWARAIHLVELAQVLCYHDFAQQTDW